MPPETCCAAGAATRPHGTACFHLQEGSGGIVRTPEIVSLSLPESFLFPVRLSREEEISALIVPDDNQRRFLARMRERKSCAQRCARTAWPARRLGRELRQAATGEDIMSPELIAIPAVGAAVVGIVFVGQRNTAA